MKNLILFIVLILVAVGAIVIIVMNVTKRGGEISPYQIPSGRYDCFLIPTAGSTILTSPKFPKIGSAAQGGVPSLPAPTCQDEKPLFGGPFVIGVYAKDANVARLVMDEAFRTVSDIEHRLAADREDSEVERLNREAPTKPVRMSEDLYFIVKRAQDVTLNSGAAFDITDAPMKRVWRKALAEGRIPASDQLKEAQELVGGKYIEIDDAKRTIKFRKPGVAIDLDHMLRGFAMDRAAIRLRAGGIRQGFIRAGDSLYLLGLPDDGIADIGIPDPFKVETMKFAFQADRPSIAFGGFFRLWFMQNSRIYNDVVDPHTGNPMASVSLCVVTGPDMMTCAGIADALGVLGESKAVRFVAKFNPTEKEEFDEKAEKAKGRVD